MLGGMLAGHEESGGSVVEENGEKFMLFYGMSSESAMNRHGRRRCEIPRGRR
ncbi:GMP reductase [Salmonella enterica subsp. enterica]|uniref:GMP reductase n=1 Tax=Salmonella enterica I TaxID=59201 RepID=A0A379WEP0_SALET|nr:GMP reductase [Salmonella enterica subsp. enterica]